MNKLEEKLNSLKVLKSWKLETYDVNGNLGEGEFRNTEKLILEFTNGESLTLNTFCSGSAEDTYIFCD